MIDINLIRTNPEMVAKALAKKEFIVDFTELLKQDKQKRDLLTKAEGLKAERNRVSGLIPQYKKQGKDVAPIFEDMKKIGTDIEALDKKVAKLTAKMNELLYRLPNMPDEDVIAGGKENNKIIKTFKEKPVFNFKLKNHVEMCEALGLIDYERGVKISGAGNWIYRGMGARLEWALLNFFVEEHVADGYEFMMFPHMLNYACGFGSGQFPKFLDEVFWVDKKGEDGRFLLPTSETALVNIYRDEILQEASLPQKFAGYSPCYRREAGGYGSAERGTIRGNQFNKIEMFQYTTPKGSDAAFEELVGKACRLVEKLGLHYNLVKLAAADCTSGMARTYDVEVYIPSMNGYKEVSSVSNARDYQARRANIRYKDNATGKNEYVHILNASGLATSRVIPAIVEQFQNADGSVTVPEVLRKFLGGIDKLYPVKK